VAAQEFLRASKVEAHERRPTRLGAIWVLFWLVLARVWLCSARNCVLPRALLSAEFAAQFKHSLLPAATRPSLQTTVQPQLHGAGP
jgi:hypothetical protein